MDDIGHHSPDAEIIAFGDFNLGKLRIGGNQPETPLPLPDPLQRIFSVQLTDRNLPLGRVPLTLVYNEDVAVVHSGFYHRTALHTNQVRSVRMRTQHLQHLDVLRQLVGVQRDGETCHNLHVEIRQVHRLDAAGRQHLPQLLQGFVFQTAVSGLHLPGDTFLDEVGLVLLAVEVSSHFLVGPERIELTGSLGATCSRSLPPSAGFLQLIFRAGSVLLAWLVLLMIHGSIPLFNSFFRTKIISFLKYVIHFSVIL